MGRLSNLETYSELEWVSHCMAVPTDGLQSQEAIWNRGEETDN